MFLVYYRGNFIVAPDYKQYFASSQEAKDAMAARGIPERDYEIRVVIFTHDL